jgi:AcrR family transcriptional regulator
LLEAAADLFARRGFHGVSTDTVADAADRTSGALYAHFGAKEGLLLALVNAWENDAANEIALALEEHSDLAGRLEALWTHFVHPSNGRSDAWMLLEHELWLYAARKPDVADHLAARYADARAAMGAGFEAWAEDDGGDLPLPGSDMAVLVMGLLLGLEMQQRVDPAAVPDELALRGLRLLFGIEEERADGAA